MKTDRYFDMGLAWEWDHDREFAQRLERACLDSNLTFYQVHPANFHETLDRLKNGMKFGVYLDRASDNLDYFHQLQAFVREKGTVTLNPHSRHLHSMDKSTIHYDLISRGINLPFTYFLPACQKELSISLPPLERLGSPFVIKPAIGGGGRGVVLNATSPEEIFRVRQQFPAENYLLQERVSPGQIGDRRAYFRVIYLLSEVFPCWWDDRTHIYEELKKEDIATFKLGCLIKYSHLAAEVSGLDFFSSEICLDEKGQFVMTDYINHPCDLRSKSHCPEGLPDALLEAIVSVLVNFIRRRSKDERATAD
jgi:hypothetical protein